MLEILTKCGIETDKASEIVKAMQEAKVYTTNLENVDVRYNKLKEQNKELDNQVKGYATQLEELSKNNKDNQELIKQIEQLQLSNTQASEKMQKMEFDYALDLSLSSVKAKDNKLLRALLDMDSIKYQEGKINGLEGQIEAIKSTHGYLFEEEKPVNTGGVGNFGRGKASAITKEQFKSMSYMERMNLYNTNKDLFNQLNDN